MKFLPVPKLKKASMWESPIGEILICPAHKSKKLIVKHQGVPINRTLYDTQQQAEGAAAQFVNGRTG